MEIVEAMIDKTQPIIKRWHGKVQDALKIVNQRAKTGLHPLAADLVRALVLTQFRKDNNGAVIDTQFNPSVHIPARIVERLVSKAHMYPVWRELEDLAIVQDRKRVGEKIRKTRGRRAKDDREIWLVLDLAYISRWKTTKRYKDEQHKKLLNLRNKKQRKCRESNAVAEIYKFVISDAFANAKLAPVPATAQVPETNRERRLRHLREVPSLAKHWPHTSALAGLQGLAATA